ncbi:hypothetical protein [Natronospira bacteriovora]|uniref:TIGR04206 family protein n=1 Tax=Natronospira bacteriovora TaxID=3069753 RepID=A0ABU0W5V4_9GAMM|nr:hypothetical protein [Natronospira sp. AB-CW4]MDQ2069308.1 hypothetical protein [Natronospira sp. AB-CW4]
MSFRARLIVWREVLAARLMSLAILRPEGTEVISTVAAAALAVPVLRDPTILAMAKQYAGALGFWGATTWAWLLLAVSVAQGAALLADDRVMRQWAAAGAALLWGLFGGLIVFIQPPAVDGWAYLTLAVGNAWAVWQLHYHDGGGDA